MQEPRKIRPLLIAEAANPEFVSVPLEGWSHSAAIRELTDAHIVTQIRNRDAFARAGLVEGKDFTALDTESFSRPMRKLFDFLRMGKGKGWTTTAVMSAITYQYFERKVWQVFGDDIKSGRFDLVHRLIPLTPTISSPMAPKCAAAGVPFLLGPLNGGLPWSQGFDTERRREREWMSYIRSAYKILPGRARTYNAASAIIVGSRHTQTEIPDRHQDKCVYIPENAIDPARFSLPPREGVEIPLRGCFIGRLVPYKGADMLIEAAAPLMRDGKLVLDFIGDGPMMDELKAQAARGGVENAITWRGWVAHDQLQHVARESHLFTFPSVREFGGAVVLEAMILGVVPVIVDYGGPGEHVIEGTGYKLPIGKRAEIISNLRDLLTRITDAPEQLPAISKAGWERVQRKYTWAAKAAQTHQVYEWVLGRRTEKPDPFMDM